MYRYPSRSLLIESKWPRTGTTRGVATKLSPRAEVPSSSMTAQPHCEAARTGTRTLHSTSSQPESHQVPRGPTDPEGQLLKDKEWKTLLHKGKTDNATHLALSEPGEAPVTTDETSPRTRGLFIREGERERVHILPAVRATEDTCHKDFKEVRTDEIPEDPSKKAAM